MGKTACAEHDGDPCGLSSVGLHACQRPPAHGDWRLSALDAGIDVPREMLDLVAAMTVVLRGSLRAQVCGALVDNGNNGDGDSNLIAVFA